MQNFEFPKIGILRKSELPKLIAEMPGAPDYLYYCGDRRALFMDGYKYLCVIGSRRYSEYGRRVCEWLIEGLRGTNTVIVSGMAIGIDSIAHKAAIANNLITIAVPGSGLQPDLIYPRMNIYIAEDILKNGGCLVSPFKPEQTATPWTFPVRNQIMAGLSHATLIIEGEEDSGTLITGFLSSDYNRDTLIVPGSIFSETSRGPHKLLRFGAQAITSQEDLLEALGYVVEKENNVNKNGKSTNSSDNPSTSNNKNNLQKQSPYENCTPDELKIIKLLSSEPLHKDEIIRQTNLGVSRVHILISILETKMLVDQKFGKVSLRYPYKNT
jgi:DNA processing protein